MSESRQGTQQAPAEPLDTLWVDVHLACMTGGETGYGEIPDGALGVRDGRIDWIGPADSLPHTVRSASGEVRSGEGAWMTPGFVDCHTHLVYGGDRSAEFEARLSGASYEEIARAGGGILSTVRATAEATDEALVEHAVQRAQVLIAEGVSTLEIKSGYGLDMESEIRLLQIARAVSDRLPASVRTTLLAAHALPPEYAGRRAEYVELICTALIPEVAALGLADAVDAFCEGIAFTAEECGRIFDAATLHGFPVRLHADQLSDGGGASLLASHRGLSADHLEYCSEDGVRALAAAGSVAVLLPGAFLFLGETQLPPIASFRAQGVPIAVATDSNPGSSPLTSILQAMGLACTQFRMTPAEALLGVTKNAAQALGLDGDRGTLELGKRADLALWDIQHPRELSYWMGFNPLRSLEIAQ